jgi:hypothetical protein
MKVDFLMKLEIVDAIFLYKGSLVFWGKRSFKLLSKKLQLHLHAIKTGQLPMVYKFCVQKDIITRDRLNEMAVRFTFPRHEEKESKMLIYFQRLHNPY